MKPMVSQCAAVTDPKAPSHTRCKIRPSIKNGYFCEKHWLELHEHKINAVRVRDMPNVVGSQSECVIVFAGKPKKKKKATPEKQAEKVDKPQTDRNYIISEKVKEYGSLGNVELVTIAKAFGITGKMSRKELIKAIINKEMGDDKTQ